MSTEPQDKPFEPEPDGWDRFERAFDQVVKVPAPKDTSEQPKRPRGRPRKTPAPPAKG